MTNRTLKKALRRFGQIPSEELERLMAMALKDNELLTLLLDNDKMGHCIVKDGTIIFANTTFCTLLPTERKYLGRKAEGKTLSELVKDRDVLDFMTGLGDKGFEEGKEFYFQSGSEVRTVNVFSRILTFSGESYVDFSALDITEDKRKETRLRRSESLASMTTMAAGIAHEIKNPLAAMKIHLQLLRRTFQKKGLLSEDDAERYLSVLEEEIERLNGIAVDFLFAVRPMNVELKLQEIMPIIESLVSFVEPEMEENGIKISFEGDSFLPRLFLDSKYLNQALLNIIKNAENAMEGKGGEIKISVRSEGDSVSLSIRDTGCGIEREKISKIFEPYYTTKASGTGLGLTVVFKVIKEHHGDISVDSEVGKGTVFTLRFPVPRSERIALESGGEA